MTIKASYILFLATALALAVSCDKFKQNKNKIHTKKEVVMGADVQPEEDVVNAEISDTATFYAHTILNDSSISFPDQYKYLGSNQDPVFGRTDASIFTNFSIANNVTNISFGNDAVLDSAQIILVFTQNYVGDTTTALHYKVHQLTTALDRTQAYYMNNTSVSYNSNTLSDATARLSYTNGFYTIKLPLDYNFASSLLTNPAYLASNTILHDAYKGLYITTSSSNLIPGSQEGALMKIDLDNAVSGIYMYYHNTSAAVKTPKAYRFSFSGDNAARFNKMSYAKNSIPNNALSKILNDHDTTVQTNKSLFLKGLGGTKVIYRLPYLKNYSATEKISVARAEIVFKVDQAYPTPIQYDPPIQLALVMIDANHKEYYLKDQYTSSDALRLGGNYDPENKQYVFNIARHVQDILNGNTPNYGFYLVVANPDPIYVARRDDKAARVVLGGKNSLYAPTFKLSFVRYSHDS